MKPSISHPPDDIHQAGFTIIEVLIALSIFAIGILGVAAMQLSSIQGNARAREVTNVATMAADRLEKLTRLSFSATDLTAGSHAPAQNADGIDNDGDGQVDETGESGDFTVSWSVAEDTIIDNTKVVTVSVSYRKNGTGPLKAATVEGIVPEII